MAAASRCAQLRQVRYMSPLLLGQCEGDSASSAIDSSAADYSQIGGSVCFSIDRRLKQVMLRARQGSGGKVTLRPSGGKCGRSFIWSHRSLCIVLPRGSSLNSICFWVIISHHSYLVSSAAQTNLSAARPAGASWKGV